MNAGWVVELNIRVFPHFCIIVIPLFIINYHSERGRVYAIHRNLNKTFLLSLKVPRKHRNPTVPFYFLFNILEIRGGGVFFFLFPLKGL